MKNSVLRLALAIAGVTVLSGCIGALAPVAVVGGQVKRFDIKYT